MEEYLELHRFVYQVTEAVREEVGAERMYLYSFGSNQGNSHVHWHVVPLAPGVPYDEQQGAWASWSKGVLRIPKGDGLTRRAHGIRGRTDLHRHSGLQLNFFNEGRQGRSSSQNSLSTHLHQ